MARIDDGELYLEIEAASEEQLRRGLRAARQYIGRCGVYVEEAMRSAALRDRETWDAGEGERAEELTDADYDNAEIADEVWLAALNAAGFSSGTLGILPPEQRTRDRPVVRDLFEVVS